MSHITEHSLYITTSLGSSLIIILIFINYISKFNADNFQRKLFLLLLCAGLIAIINDFIRNFFESGSASCVNGLLYTVNSLFLIAQNCTYYLGAVFIDYFTHKNTQRSKKFIIIITTFLAVFSLSVIINLFFGYYFTISSTNYFVPGKLYPLRLVISYGSVFLIIINVLLSYKYFKHSQVYSIILFLAIIAIGSVIDLVFDKGSLVWPCFTAAVLYIYLFIIQSDLKIDSLTGIGNRSSFNEFIDKITHQSSRLDYSIVMIDMDKFKEINDTLGHLEGDNALRDVARIIKLCIRHLDFVARYGGDEFVLAARADSDIQTLMNRITDAIRQQNEKRIHPYQLYISYGYDVFTTNSGESIDDFLAKIDAMMYKQKEERKKKGIPSSITANLPQTTDSN